MRVAAAETEIGRTWIANRPAQVEPFDRVVVMQAGRVVAQGSPAELASNGLYCELMKSA